MIQLITVVVLVALAAILILARKQKGDAHAQIRRSPEAVSNDDDLGLFISGPLVRSITPSETETRKLLAEATRKKDDGDFGGACGLLRQAYARLNYSDSEPIETYLRLPLYLQKAGLADEALAEARWLLENFHHSLPKVERLCLPMTRSAIYDKLRLILQREKRYEEAVRYGVLSHLSWAQGLARQGRKEELTNLLEPEAVAMDLLKKTSKIAAVNDVAAIVADEMKDLRKLEPSRVDRRISDVLSVTPKEKKI